MKISKIINNARLNSKCTMGTVEKETGVLASNQSKIELGNNKNPGFFAIGKLAEFYGLDLNEIYKTTQSKNSNALLVSNSKLATAVPVLRYEEIFRWLQEDNTVISEKTRTKDVSEKCSRLSFAVTIKDDSMTSYTGGDHSFPAGSTVIVDPEIPMKNNSFVMVRWKNNDVVSFRKAVKMDGCWYFKCINTQYQILSTSQDYEMLGTAISMSMSVRVL